MPQIYKCMQCATFVIEVYNKGLKAQCDCALFFSLRLNASAKQQEIYKSSLNISINQQQQAITATKL